MLDRYFHVDSLVSVFMSTNNSVVFVIGDSVIFVTRLRHIDAFCSDCVTSLVLCLYIKSLCKNTS